VVETADSCSEGEQFLAEYVRIAGKRKFLLAWN
jgi:hypothetical protein